MRRLVFVILLLGPISGQADVLLEEYSRMLFEQKREIPARCRNLSPVQFRICVAQIDEASVPENPANVAPSKQDPDHADRGDYYSAAASQANHGRAASNASHMDLLVNSIEWSNSSDPSQRIAGAQLRQAAADYLNQSKAFAAAIPANLRGLRAVKDSDGIAPGARPSAAAPASGDATEAGQGDDSANMKALESTLLSPGLRQSLEAKGIDADEFISKLKGREFESPTDILRAMGDTGEYSEEEIDAGKALANQRLSAFHGGGAELPSDDATSQPSAPVASGPRGQMFHSDSTEGGILAGTPYTRLGSYLVTGPTELDGDLNVSTRYTAMSDGGPVTARQIWQGLGVRALPVRKTIFDLARHEYRQIRGPNSARGAVAHD